MSLNIENKSIRKVCGNTVNMHTSGLNVTKKFCLADKIVINAVDIHGCFNATENLPYLDNDELGENRNHKKSLSEIIA